MIDQRLRRYITQLKNPNYHVRNRAAHALGKIDDVRAIPILVQALGDFDAADESSKVNMTAGTALIGYGNQARDALIAALAIQPDHPYDSWRRHWTADTLGFFPSESTTKALINVLEDADQSVVQGAVEAIIRLRLQEALPYVQHLYEQRPFPNGYIYTILREAIERLNQANDSQ